MANKKAPITLGGMQAAMAGAEPIDQQLIHASEVASKAAPTVGRNDKSIIYMLVDTNKRGNLNFILIDDVKARPRKDEKGNLVPGSGNERIRVLTGVDTIWQKDQKDIDKDYIKSNKRYLVFQKGRAIVPEWDAQVHEFMELSNANIDNPNKTLPRNTLFYKWNPAKQAEEMRKKQTERIKAILTANEADPLAMRKHAIYLGIQLTDVLGEPLPEEGLRVSYCAFADSNPVIFLQSLNSREVEITYMVKKALVDTKIDTGRGHNDVYWADGRKICRVPMSQTAQNYLVELAMTNSEEGKEFLAELQQKII